MRRFPFPDSDGEIDRFAVQHYLDLATRLAYQHDEFSPLKYAIKRVPQNLNEWASRFFIQTSMNLALLHPYLAREMGEFVFDKHPIDGSRDAIQRFCNRLLINGVKNVQPDAISHALHFALKYELSMPEVLDYSEAILELGDCVTVVLLHEYALAHQLNGINKSVKCFADEFVNDLRKQDRNWLLIYQLWSVDELIGRGQPFLGKLKRNGFSFVNPT